MITPELENYIKQSRAQGVADAQIRQNLMASGGWSPADLDQAFSVFSTPASIAPTVVATASHMGLILSVIGILILAGGGYFGYQYFLKYKFSQSIMVFDTPDWEKSNVSPDPAVSTSTENKSSITSEQEKDCGIALSDKEFEDRAGCMGLALATCSPAKMAQGPTSERLTITIKPEGNSCILSASSNVVVPGFELKTCKFSNSSLSTLRSEVLSLQKSINPSFKGDAMDESINTNLFLGIFEATLDDKTLKSLQTGTASFSKVDVTCQ